MLDSHADSRKTAIVVFLVESLLTAAADKVETSPQQFGGIKFSIGGFSSVLAFCTVFHKNRKSLALAVL